MAHVIHPSQYNMPSEKAVDPAYINDNPFYKDEKTLTVGQGCFYFDTETTSNLDLRSDQIKLLVPASNSFYYMINNFLGEILYYHNYFKDKIQIVYCMQDFEVPYHHPVNVFNAVHEYIFKLLDFHKVNYTVYVQSIHGGLLVNNYYLAKNYSYTGFANLVYNHAEEMRQSKYGDKKEPHRKVYLSRKHFYERPVYEQEIAAKNALIVNHDNRIDDHEKLELFLEELGFEIINPEKFPSFEDQIQYFSEVKCVASLTSSGLVNAIFMQPKQTVLEITTPLPLFYGNIFEDQIHYYHAMTAFSKYHKYIAINNLTRSVDLVIDQIKSDKNLYDYIKNV